MTVSAVRRVVRASAIYDIIATAAFALPWTAAPAFDGLRHLQQTFGLSGTLPSADDAFTTLFANLMGSLVLVWSVVRVLRPGVTVGVADTVARMLFSLGMISALHAGGSTVLVGFLVLEIAWAVGQASVIVLTRSTGRNDRASVPA